MTTVTHQIDNRLTALGIAYGNEPNDYIAERIAPRTPSPHAGQYQKVADGSRFQGNKTKMGYGTVPEQIATSSSLIAYVLEYHGLDAPVDLAQNADVSMDRETMNMLHNEALLSALASMNLSREKEVRDEVYKVANYSNNAIVAGADQFNAATSNPIKLIRDACAKPLAMPNVGVCGINVFNALASNSAINQAAHGNDGDKGFQSAETIARLLGLERIIVGKAWDAAGKIGDKPSTRVWDSADSLALIRVAPVMSLRAHNSAAFAVTASARGGMQVRRFMAEKDGPDGSEIIRPVDQRKLLVLSTEAGYLLSDCLA